MSVFILFIHGITDIVVFSRSGILAPEIHLSP